MAEIKKVCTSCKEEKPLEDFIKSKERKSGRRAVCKKCVNNKNKITLQNPINREKVNKYHRDYNKKKPERKLYKTNYRKENYGRTLLGSAKARAKRKGLAFNITLDDIIIPEFCPILGIKIEYSEHKKVKDSSASIDKIDPKKGYIKGNVCVISYKANRMKGHCTLDELYKIINYIENGRI